MSENNHLEEKKNVLDAKAIFAIVTYLTLGCCAGLLMINFLPEDVKLKAITTFDKLLLIPISIITLLISIFFHQSGKLIAGKLVGLKFNRFNCGPLAFIKIDGKTKIKFFKKADPSSDLIFEYQKNDIENNKKFKIMIAGGFLFSIILISLFLLMNLLFIRNPTFISDYFYKFFNSSGLIISSLVFIIYLLPFSNGNSFNEIRFFFAKLKNDEIKKEIVNEASE